MLTAPPVSAPMLMIMAARGRWSMRERQAVTVERWRPSDEGGHPQSVRRYSGERPKRAGTTRRHLLRIFGARKSVVAVTGGGLLNVRSAHMDQARQNSEMT